MIGGAGSKQLLPTRLPFDISQHGLEPSTTIREK
jgi:hypothetical protein